MPEYDVPIGGRTYTLHPDHELSTEELRSIVGKLKAMAAGNPVPVDPTAGGSVGVLPDASAPTDAVLGYSPGKPWSPPAKPSGVSTPKPGSAKPVPATDPRARLTPFFQGVVSGAKPANPSPAFRPTPVPKPNPNPLNPMPDRAALLRYKAAERARMARIRQEGLEQAAYEENQARTAYKSLPTPYDPSIDSSRNAEGLTPMQSGREGLSDTEKAAEAMRRGMQIGIGRNLLHPNAAISPGSIDNDNGLSPLDARKLYEQVGTVGKTASYFVPELGTASFLMDFLLNPPKTSDDLISQAVQLLALGGLGHAAPLLKELIPPGLGSGLGKVLDRVPYAQGFADMARSIPGSSVPEALARARSSYSRVGMTDAERALMKKPGEAAPQAPANSPTDRGSIVHLDGTTEPVEILGEENGTTRVRLPDGREDSVSSILVSRVRRAAPAPADAPPSPEAQAPPSATETAATPQEPAIAQPDAHFLNVAQRFSDRGNGTVHPQGDRTIAIRTGNGQVWAIDLAPKIDATPEGAMAAGHGEGVQVTDRGAFGMYQPGNGRTVVIDGQAAPVDHVVTLSEAHGLENLGEALAHESSHAAQASARAMIQAGIRSVLTPEEMSALHSYYDGMEVKNPDGASYKVDGEEGASIAVQNLYRTGRYTDPRTGKVGPAPTWIRKVVGWLKDLGQMVSDHPAWKQRRVAEGAVKRIAEGDVWREGSGEIRAGSGEREAASAEPQTGSGEIGNVPRSIELSTSEPQTPDVKVGDLVTIDGKKDATGITGTVVSVRSQVRTEPVFHDTDPASLWKGKRTIRYTTVNTQNSWLQESSHTFKEVLGEDKPPGHLEPGSHDSGEKFATGPRGDKEQRKVVVPVDPFGKHASIEDLRSAARDWSYENIAEKNYRVASDGSIVRVQVGGIEHVLASHPDATKIRLLASVPDLIEHGRFIEEVPDYRGNPKLSIRKYQTEAEIDGKPVQVDWVARKVPGQDGFYYDHNYTKVEPAGNKISGATSEEAATRPTTGSDPIVQQPPEGDGTRFAANPRETPEPEPTPEGTKTRLIDEYPGLRNLPAEYWDQAEEALRASGVERQASQTVDEYKGQLERSYGYTPEMAAAVANSGARTPQDVVYLNEAWNRVNADRKAAEGVYDSMVSQHGENSPQAREAKARADRMYEIERDVMQAATHGSSELGRGLRLLQDVGDRKLDFKIRVRDLERQIGRPLTEQEYKTHAKLMEELNRVVSEAEGRSGAHGQEVAAKQQELDDLKRERASLKEQVDNARKSLGSYNQSVKTAEAKLQTLSQRIADKQATLEELRKQVASAKGKVKRMGKAVLEDPAVQEAATKVLQHENALNAMPWWQSLLSIRKLGLLTNPRTLFRNALGNAVRWARTEGLRPADAFFDGLISMRAGTDRTIPGWFQIKERSAAAAFRATLGDVSSIARHGATADQIAIMESLNRKTGVKALDSVISFAQKLQSMQDRPWWNIAYQRSLAEQATLLEKRTGIAAHSWMIAPTEAMLTQATADAEFSIYASQNNFTKFFNRVQRLHPVANFTIDMVMPFKKVPANIGADIATSNPLGALYNYYKYKGEMSKALAEGDKAAAAMAQKKLARAYTSSALGSGLLMLGYYLASRRLLSGASPKGGQERATKDAADVQPSSLVIGGRRYSLSGLNPDLNIMALGATIYDSYANAEQENKDIEFKAMDSGSEVNPDDRANPLVTGGLGFLRLLEDQPFYTGFKQIGDAMDQGGWTRYGGQLAGSFIPTAVGDIRQMVKPDTVVRKPVDLSDAINMRLGLSEKVPPKVTALGETQERSREDTIDIFRARPNPQPGSVKDEMLRLRVYLSNQSRGRNDTKETLPDKQKAVGQAVNNALRDLINGGKFLPIAPRASKKDYVERFATMEAAGYIDGKPYAEQTDDAKRLMLSFTIARVRRDALKEYQGRDTNAQSARR